VGGIVIGWFVLQLATVVTSFSVGFGSSFGTGFGSGDSADLAEQFRDSIGASVVSGLLGVATTVTFIVVIRQLTARHMAATGEAAQ
jgi:ABC-type Fe3+ transport system permease subunit